MFNIFMRFLTLFITLLFILFSFSFAAECKGYNEELTIRVLDALIRPVDGANVQVTFDRGVPFGEQYLTTKPKQTDENGTVLFAVWNQGIAPRKLDCNIYITAWAGGASNKKTIVAYQHPVIIDVYLPIYRVLFYVHDQNGRPLANATVFFLNETKTSDEFGRAVFYSKNATSDYYVSYKTGSEGGSVSVKGGDATREAVIPVYQITVFTKDDYGNPLPALISYANETLNAVNGSATLTVYKDVAYLKVKHENLEKELTLRPAEEPTKTIFFDLRAPSISDPRQTIANNRVRMSFDVKDEGGYASGLDISSIKVSYRLATDEMWHSSMTYSLGGDAYGIDFPETQPNAIVEFSVQASDYEGNTAYKKGRFVVSTVAGQGSEAAQENNVVNEEFPWLYAFLVIIFIIFAFYVLRLLFKKQKE